MIGRLQIKRENYTPYEYSTKESWNNYINIRQNRLKSEYTANDKMQHYMLIKWSICQDVR